MKKIDIVEQLRAYGHPARSASHKMALEAAKEIERLRELLKRYSESTSTKVKEV